MVTSKAGIEASLGWMRLRTMPDGSLCKLSRIVLAPASTPYLQYFALSRISRMFSIVGCFQSCYNLLFLPRIFTLVAEVDCESFCTQTSLTPGGPNE